MAEPLKSPTKELSGLVRDEISRRGLSKSETATTPITPPARYISSNFSTPGSTFGKEEDAIIIELTPRHLKAGIEGESYPQCRYDFKSANAKRLGDYRQWMPGYIPPKEHLDTWGQDHELWRNDLRDVSLGLLSDQLERAVREVYNKNLLVDAGVARLVLVVPSLLPHPVLATVLQTLFERWTFPSISLLPTPATALVAAGLRSGLVVDIGWEETVVTAVYEYREVRVGRTTRAVKMLTKNFASWAQESLVPEHRFDLETVEGFLKRIGLQLALLEENTHGEADEDEITVDWPTDTFTRSVKFSTKEVQANVQNTILGKSGEVHQDDEEFPVPRVMYNTLLKLPTDARGVCLSRIVFVGEGSDSYGLKTMVLRDFSRLLDSRGWTEVQGEKVKRKREGLLELAQGRAQPADVKHDDLLWSEKAVTEERYLREKAKQSQTVIHGIVRQVETLGPWVGASLLTTLKTKSFVEIQRDKFLSHGLAGASKDFDGSVVPQTRVSTIGMRPKAGERTSWTLSGWG